MAMGLLFMMAWRIDVCDMLGSEWEGGIMELVRPVLGSATDGNNGGLAGTELSVGMGELDLMVTGVQDKVR